MGVMIVFGTIALIAVIAQRVAGGADQPRFETVAVGTTADRVHLLQRDGEGRERLVTLDAETGGVARVGPVLDVPAD